MSTNELLYNLTFCWASRSSWYSSKKEKQASNVVKSIPLHWPASNAQTTSWQASNRAWDSGADTARGSTLSARAHSVKALLHSPPELNTHCSCTAQSARLRAERKPTWPSTPSRVPRNSLPASAENRLLQSSLHTLNTTSHRTASEGQVSAESCGLIKGPKNSSRNSEVRKFTSSLVKHPHDRSNSTTASSTNRGILDGKQAELDPCSRSLKVKACSWQWSLSRGGRVEPLALLDRRLFHSTAKQFRTRTWKSSVCWQMTKIWGLHWNIDTFITIKKKIFNRLQGFHTFWPMNVHFFPD